MFRFVIFSFFSVAFVIFSHSINAANRLVQVPSQYQVTVANDSDKEKISYLAWWPQNNNYNGQPPNTYHEIPKKSSIQFIYNGQLKQLIAPSVHNNQLIITPCSNNNGYGCISYGLPTGGGCQLEYGWNTATQLCEGKITSVNADRGEKVNCTGGVATGGRPNQNNMCLYNMAITPVPAVPPKHYEVVIDNHLFTDLHPLSYSAKTITMPNVEDGMTAGFTFTDLASNSPPKKIIYSLMDIGDGTGQNFWPVQCEYTVGWDTQKRECSGTSKQIGGNFSMYMFHSTCGGDAYAVIRRGDMCMIIFNIAAEPAIS